MYTTAATITYCSMGYKVKTGNWMATLCLKLFAFTQVTLYVIFSELAEDFCYYWIKQKYLFLPVSNCFAKLMLTTIVCDSNRDWDDLLYFI